ncbi:hypothetical protein [Nitrosomonas sp.]|uniref:hypothetical protein n=1 Tax=Nitrosomonas sp. TaxID=42353 RepID=UPI0037C5B579
MLLAFSVASFAAILINDYTGYWVAIVAVSIFNSYFSRKSTRLFWIIIGLYLALGLLNISSWRGTTELVTIKAYFLGILFFSIPFYVLYIRSYRPYYLLVAPKNHNVVFMRIAYLHIAISFLAVAYVYATTGPIFLNPSLRFKVPVAVSYIIKSSLPLAAFVPFMAIRRQWLMVLIIILPSILMSFRGVAVLAALSYILVLIDLQGAKIYWKTKIKLKKFSLRRFLYFGIIAFVIISAGFYMRRTSSDVLLSAEELVNTYFSQTGWWVYTIMPLYLGFKETIGITNNIISREIDNSLNDYPLFFADLYTILPGTWLAAGQTLNQLFGATEAGGLTPGLVGGIFIDYGWNFITFFLFFGAAITFFAIKSSKSVYFLPLYITILTQFIHLFHRGFLKPEYVTTIMLAAFYSLILRGIRFRRNTY